MNLSFEDIKELVLSKESCSLELKVTTGQLTRGMETGCAFMNSQTGGYVLFGVNDQGQVIGQEISDKTRREIASVLKRFEPTVLADVQYVKIPGENKYVIAIYFEDYMAKKPYLFDGRAYLRIESTTSAMSQDIYHELLIERNREQFRWEACPNTKILIDSFDKEKIIGTIRLGIENGRLPESSLENLDIKVLLDKLNLVEDGIFRNASAVLFQKQPFQYFPQCKLRLARFKGIDRLEFIDNIQITGNVFVLFDTAMLFFFKHLSLSGSVEKAEREEELSVPYKALREATVNALCHRDYACPEGSVGIAIYDDRVEIMNSGSLPKEIVCTNLRLPHKSFPHNPLIANIFFRRRMVESWGRGLELMHRECERVGLPVPVLSSEHGEVMVVFHFKQVEQVTEQVTEQVAEQVAEQVKRLLEVLNSRELTLKEVLVELGLRHRPTLIYTYIQPALHDDLIEQTQPDSPNSPTQKYKLTEKGRKLWIKILSKNGQL